MASLQRKPEHRTADGGVTLVHSITNENSPLEYVQFKVIDLDETATYSESLTGWECCIVAVRGKVNVSVMDAGQSDSESQSRADDPEVFSNLGTRDSVFSQQPTDSVYVSTSKHFTVEGLTSARVALCYAPSLQARPTTLIRAADNSIEHRAS